MEIRVQDLAKSYGGVTVLSGVTFTARPGVLRIVGASGAGKTTLLRLILGLETPDRGTIRGTDGLRWGAVFQEDRLLERLDAAGNLRFVLGRDYDGEAAREVLAALGLAHAGNRPAGTFSGGMKRRLALARALLAPGGGLLLDEPFAGLDGENRRRAVSCIRRWGAGKVILLAAHSREDGLEGAVLTLENGRPV